MSYSRTYRAPDELQADLVNHRAARATMLTLHPFNRAAAAACNGHEEFCTRTYSNVSVVGAHNSYGVSAGSSEWLAFRLRAARIAHLVLPYSRRQPKLHGRDSAR